MQDFLSDEIVNLTFSYGDGSRPLVPDVASVTYSVLDHSGTPIVGLENLPITTSAATLASTISIPAIHNTIDLTKAFERRHVIVRFTSGGQGYVKRVVYRLVPFVQYSVTPQAIRTFLGVNDGEIADSDIDIFNAYLFVREAFNDPNTLDAALVSGGRLEILANDAIAMRAAIDVIPSLQNRVVQSEKNGPMGFERAKIVDFATLLEAATRRYIDALNALNEVDTSAGDVTLIVVTQDTDPITAGT